MVKQSPNVQKSDVEFLDIITNADMSLKTCRKRISRQLRAKVTGVFSFSYEHTCESIEIGEIRSMRGDDLKKWRKRCGYTQEALMRELDIKARQTLSSWENSADKIPRMVELALIALEKIPDSRSQFGKAATAKERRAFEKAHRNKNL